MYDSKPVTLTSSDMELQVATESGARIISLTDRHTGRNWLAESEPPRIAWDDAIYGLREAAGWDECYPTVSPCDARATPWRRRLRDHGDLWGRPSEVTARGTDHLQTTFERHGFRFIHRLEVTGSVLDIAYGVETTLGKPTPFLWAMHPLFALLPGEAIVLESASQKTVGSADRRFRVRARTRVRPCDRFTRLICRRLPCHFALFSQFGHTPPLEAAHAAFSSARARFMFIAQATNCRWQLLRASPR